MTCSAVPVNKLISTFTMYQFTVTPTMVLPSNGYLIVKFPARWSDSAENDVLNYLACANTGSNYFIL
jgi:hypothetical protein